ncbi:MAG: hypothetical protein V3V92_00045 [Candidatus Hydrothermarchaeales archaeon]
MEKDYESVELENTIKDILVRNKSYAFKSKSINKRLRKRGIEINGWKLAQILRKMVAKGEVKKVKGNSKLFRYQWINDLKQKPV